MKKLAVSMFMISSLMLGGCGGDTGVFAIGGTLSGLASGENLIVELVASDGVESLYLSDDGAFIFEDKLKKGETFGLSVGEQPDGQMCVITPAQGEAEDSNIANIVIQCVTLP